MNGLENLVPFVFMPVTPIPSVFINFPLFMVFAYMRIKSSKKIICRIVTKYLQKRQFSDAKRLYVYKVSYFYRLVSYGNAGTITYEYGNDALRRVWHEH